MNRLRALCLILLLTVTAPCQEIPALNEHLQSIVRDAQSPVNSTMPLPPEDQTLDEEEDPGSAVPS